MFTEKIIVGKNTKYPLKGILTLPDTATPCPAVVFVHGSGSSNMDEKVMKLTPFKDLAEGLVKHGIASVRYNKRSYAHAFKVLREKNLTVREETIEDAILAAELLRQDPRIDPERIFIVGHSMGAMLAPRIDAEGGNFKGLILMAGTPRRLEEVLKEQIDDMMQQMNLLVKKLSAKKLQKLLAGFDDLYQISEEEAKRRKYGGGVNMYYFQEMGLHPVSDYLEKTSKPMLILQGEKDFQVKAEVDFKLYQELLKDRDNVTFKLYENLNHVFVPSVYGNIMKAKQEYSVEQHIGEEVIGDMADWILAQ